ncbi:MAG: DUF3352 domain-containing protein [Aggregatilineales bacterium]
MSRLIKLLYLIVVVALLAANLTAPAVLSARSTPTGSAFLSQADIQGLAALMPADSTLFFVLRTDDNYIDQLDSLWQKIYARVASVGVPSSLKALLDEAAARLGGDFQTAVRSWLGDSAAFGIGSVSKLFDSNRRNDLESEILLAVQITNRAEVEKLFERFAQPSGYTKTSTEAFTDYEDVNEPILLRVTENLLLLGTAAGVKSTQNRAAKLNGNPQFKETISALPEEGYNILLYYNLTNLIDQVSELLPPGQSDLLRQSGAIAFGATILDGRTLTLDFAIPNTAEILYGIDLTGPTDPAFARFMPANTILSIQLHNLKNYYEAILAAFRANFLTREDGQPFEQTLQQLENILRLALRLDLNEDILGWMTGDAALFIAYTPQERSLFELGLDPTLRLPFVGYDFGLLIESSDPGKAARFVAELGTVLESSLRDTPNLTLTQAEKHFTIAVNVPNLTTPIELMIGAEGPIFYVATSAAAAHIQSGEEGLSAAAGYREALQYMLPESIQIWYMGSDAMNLLGEIVASQNGPRRLLLERFPQVRSNWQIVASLLSSSAISLAVKDGFQVMRATLSLSE